MLAHSSALLDHVNAISNTCAFPARVERSPSKLKLTGVENEQKHNMDKNVECSCHHDTTTWRSFATEH